MVEKLNNLILDKFLTQKVEFIVMNKSTSEEILFELLGECQDLELTLERYKELPVYLSESLEFGELKIG